MALTPSEAPFNVAQLGVLMNFITLTISGGEQLPKQATE
jgi:hypothetical protein